MEVTVAQIIKEYVCTWRRLVELLAAQLTDGGLQLFNHHVIGQEVGLGQLLLQELPQLLQLELQQAL